MDVSNFTEKSKESISIASNIATKNNNPEIKDCHMVAAFLDDKGGVITMLFKKLFPIVSDMPSNLGSTASLN